MVWCVLTQTTTDSNLGIVHLFLSKTFSLRSGGVLVSVSRHGFSWVHGPEEETINVLVCTPDPLPFFRDSVQFTLFQWLDNLVYCQSPYYDGYTLAELTPTPDDQSHLVLIIQRNSGELYPD